MTPEEKQVATHFCESLWAHDAWMWGNTCSALMNREIDFDAPAELARNGKYYKITVCTRDGRELEMAYKKSGWSLGYVKPENQRLTIRTADSPMCRVCGESIVFKDGLCEECGLLSKGAADGRVCTCDKPSSYEMVDGWFCGNCGMPVAL